MSQDILDLVKRDGLEKLADRYATELTTAVAAAKDLAKALPKDLHWSEESAHIFRLPASLETKS
jgi:hypothetical protein